MMIPSAMVTSEYSYTTFIIIDLEWDKYILVMVSRPLDVTSNSLYSHLILISEYRPSINYFYP